MKSTEAEAAVTAVELARLSGAVPADIHYWGKKGYLEKKGGLSSFPVSQLPKAKMMVLLAGRLQIRPKKASELSDEFLLPYQNRPDAFTAMVAVVEALDTRITQFVDLVLELHLVERIRKIVGGEPS